MYLSAKQVKDRYQITNQTLYNWRRLNKIVYHKLPSGKIMYESLDLKLWLKSQKSSIQNFQLKRN